MKSLILAIDQGTTSTRAIAFEASEGGLRPVAVSQIELAQHFPRPGWVEHDAAEIWAATLQTCREVIRKAGGVGRFAAIGITNQRETSVLWDAATGEPLHRAIVWQDRRTADVTAKLAAAGHEPMVQAATGLILDPYFSASKFAWLLDAVPGARARAEAGAVKVGTIETWLIWKLTGGASHVTDATNASRTSLMDLATRQWRPDLADLFNVPMAALPEIRDCADHL
ncbi:MAG: FGGY family carbohydrate kinase, partial [Brevundimonas sp.]|uniref:FGGY family carbohydrate kinase n=1 Tax=Brevundimonas sp. TaxID=1871086 RepID=UPI00271D27D7